MNLTLLDWSIVIGVLAVMASGVLISRGYMRSVADFLAAGRSAGRYVLTMSQGLAALGAITIVANLEMNYVAGFSMSWWGMSMSIVVLVLTVSGWVIYRFRQTRCLTLAEFFERRYSRRFRVFAGIVAFVSGLINFGIFPAVGARFFIHFCGLPQHVSLVGLELPVYPLTMIVLLTVSLFFVFSGGQIAVILTDFIQGLFVNIVFVVLCIYLLTVVDWTHIFEALAQAPEDASLINPFKTSHVEDFNLWFHLIAIAGAIYGVMSWQGTQAYNASARSAHEAKMGGVLTNFRGFPQNLMLLFVPIVTYTVMHHPDFAAVAERIGTTLEGVETDALRSQLRTPLVLVELLPVGLMGAFAAVMLAAFVSTHDTYLHSWGSIFIQDVVMPFRRKPLGARQHLRLLRLSILGVAVFIFLFSLLFKQNEYILLFFAITGAIFAGGSGAVIIGGLYWRRGTTAAAWCAMLTGSGIAVAGIVIHRYVEDFFINGQVFWALAMGGAVLSYIVVSLLSRQEPFDLDRLLHRGDHVVDEEMTIVEEQPRLGFKLLGMGREFTRGDRAIYFAAYAWTLTWTAIFVVGTIYNLTHAVNDLAWARFWRVFVYINLAMSVLVVFWFGICGFRDVRAMLRRLATQQRDTTDDGSVASENAPS
ncbi:MAG: sodium:solute symporter [bacterium]|nr:sodium:solute symporter [bacterium]